MQELAQVLAILRLIRCQLDRATIQLLRLFQELVLPTQVRNLSGRGCIFGIGLDDTIPNL
jgi:uncharacterized protein YlaN (UPF0358 family)